MECLGVGISTNSQNIQELVEQGSLASLKKKLWGEGLRAFRQ